MDRRITDALARHPGIDDWTVRRQNGRGVQIYLVGDAVESVRQVAREAYEVEIFNDHQTDGGAARGGTVIPLARSDLDDLPRLLADGVTIAGQVHSPPWTLPGPAELPDVKLADPDIVDVVDALAAGRRAADEIRRLVEQHRGDGVRLSAAELFLTTVEEELLNSQGAEGSATSTHALLEMTLLARSGEEEAESFRQAETRRLADLDLAGSVSDLAHLARDAARARTPRTRMGPVVIGGDAISQLLGGSVTGSPGALLGQASAASAYLKISRFELGRPVYGGSDPIGDLLTLHASAVVPYAVGSYRFDPDGVPGQELRVIRDGILEARPATKRYADYLGVTATGRPTLARVEPGTTPALDLVADGPACEVLAFSAPNVDALSGNFGMEIRLGYEHGLDGSRRPVKGGSVTGNLFEAMADARFSKETRLFPAYAGPAAIRFGRLQVSGED